MTPQNSAPERFGRPFPKGKSGNPGGLSKRVRAFRKEAEKRLPKALLRLDAMLDGEDVDDWKFALEWLRKAFIPSPDKAVAAQNAEPSGNAPTLPENVRNMLARMQ